MLTSSSISILTLLRLILCSFWPSKHYLWLNFFLCFLFYLDPIYYPLPFLVVVKSFQLVELMLMVAKLSKEEKEEDIVALGFVEIASFLVE